MSIMN